MNQHLQIAEILYKVACKQELTASEATVLANWQQEAPDKRRIVALAENDDELNAAIGEIYSFDKEKIWQELVDRKQKNMPVQGTGRLRTIWLRYAAAAVLVLISGAYLYNTSLKKKEEQTAAVAIVQDVPPGTEGAILTLADGTRITLDSLQNGVIAVEKGTEITLSNGSLAYGAMSNKRGEMAFNTMSTPRGRQFLLVLPDKTKVWLNAESSIRYPTVFYGKERVVQVEGEAYFEVTKNAQAPFKVILRDSSNIEVLGTSFNVNSYYADSSSKTTLVEGSVKVNAGKRTQLLRPGQQAVVSKDQSLQLNSNPNIRQVTAWKNGVFNFEEVHVKEVMNQLERWYDIQVVYESGIPDIRFWGEISRDLSLGDVIEALQKTEVHFRIEGRKLIVMK